MTASVGKVRSPVLSESRPAGALSIFQTISHALARLLFGKLLPRLPYPVLRGPLRGCWYLLGATAGEAGGVSVHFALQEVEQAKRLASLLRPGQVFFDVGANVGFYSLLGSRLVEGHGQVFAFEPMPRNIMFLCRHVDLNHARNVTIFPLACADRIMTELFYFGANNALGHLAEDNRRQQNDRAILVSTTTLDAAVERLGISPDVIKIDVEGAEMRVLKGAKDVLTRVRPSLLLSVHSAQLREACLTYLDGFNYRLEPLNGDSMEVATEFLAQPET